MINKETRGEAYKRILDSITKEIEDSKLEGIHIYSDDSNGWLNYYPELNYYKGYCKVRESRFLIHTNVLMEYAAHCENIFNFKTSLLFSKHLDVVYMGGVTISINNTLIDALINDFWTKYKALTG